MTVLVSGNVNIQSGSHESAVFAVPNGIKQPGIEMTLKLSLGAEQFPIGHTDMTLFISLDGGATYRSASMGVNMPHSFIGAAPHFWVLSFGLADNDVPTHAKYATNAPAAFTTTAKLEAL